MVRVAVIGAYGSAGVSAAETLLAAKDDGRLSELELHLIDDGDPPGGLCILRGCMPSKDVLSAAAHQFQAQKDDRLDADIVPDPAAIIERKNEHISRFAAHRAGAVDAMAQRPEVSLHRERGRFRDANSLDVGGRTIEVDYTVVATGSSPNIPDVPGIEDVPVNTSDVLLDQTELPASAVVIGFGFVGIELAPYLSTVGDTDVTVIDRNPRPLAAEPQFGDALIDLYREQFGLTIEPASAPTSVEPIDGGVRVTYERDGHTTAVDAEALYTFTGRTPNLAGLGLEQLGIEPGADLVDDTMRTPVENVFITGDANGREPILHVAKEEGIVAARNIVADVTGERPVSYRPTVHRIVFSGLGVYPFVRVGHTGTSAGSAGFDALTVTRQAADDGVFKSKDVPGGFASLVVDRDTGVILGYQGLHHHADVFAKTLQVIVETEMTVFDVPDRAYHPTTPELLDGLLREAKATLGR